MSNIAEPHDDVLDRAFHQAKNALIDRSPAIGLLTAESHLWLRMREKLADGYARGIVDVDELTEYAKTAVPSLRKIHQR